MYGHPNLFFIKQNSCVCIAIRYFRKNTVNEYKETSNKFGGNKLSLLV